MRCCCYGYLCDDTNGYDGGNDSGSVVFVVVG